MDVPLYSSLASLLNSDGRCKSGYCFENDLLFFLCYRVYLVQMGKFKVKYIE